MQVTTKGDLARLAALQTRQGRLSARQFLVEGEHMVEEAVKEGFARALFVEQTKADAFLYRWGSALPVSLLPPHHLQKLCETKTPQGVVALCDMPRLAAPMRRMVALNAVQDPGNVGTILRTMDAVGFDTLVVDQKTADPFSGKAQRASMGAIFRVAVVHADSLTEALAPLAGHQIWAGALHGQDFFARPAAHGPLCILIGNEGRGLDADALRLATHLYKIPMPGKAESLNAGVAAAVMMYDALRQDLQK